MHKLVIHSLDANVSTSQRLLSNESVVRIQYVKEVRGSSPRVDCIIIRVLYSDSYRQTLRRRMPPPLLPLPVLELQQRRLQPPSSSTALIAIRPPQPPLPRNRSGPARPPTNSRAAGRGRRAAADVVSAPAPRDVPAPASTRRGRSISRRRPR